MVVPTIYDVDILVDDTDLTVSKDIKNMGIWQPRVLRNYARFIKEGDTFLNVGCHVGIEAVVIGTHLGNNGKIFMF